MSLQFIVKFYTKLGPNITTIPESFGVSSLSLDAYPDQLHFFPTLLLSLSCFKNTIGIHSGRYRILLSKRNMLSLSSFRQAIKKNGTVTLI